MVLYGGWHLKFPFIKVKYQTRKTVNMLLQNEYTRSRHKFSNGLKPWFIINKLFLLKTYDAFERQITFKWKILLGPSHSKLIIQQGGRRLLLRKWMSLNDLIHQSDFVLSRKLRCMSIISITAAYWHLDPVFLCAFSKWAKIWNSLRFKDAKIHDYECNICMSYVI